VTLDAVLAALARAEVYDLEQPRYFGAPTFEAHAPGYLYTLHRRHEPGLGERRTSASGLIVTADHSGTHIDARCHQAEDLAMFGGCAVDATVQTSRGFTKLGVETIEPIIARGVLLDVAGASGARCLPSGHLVSGDELEAARRRQDVRCRPGDVILVRTGNGSVWAEPEAYLAGPGIGADGARWLAEQQPLAVGVDNVAVDVVGHVDAQLGSLPCHVILLVRHGVYLIENLLLEELSRSGSSEFVFVCAALKLRGATGSPVRPLAIAVRGGEGRVAL
jgi:kynurenine formamidase